MGFRGGNGGIAAAALALVLAGCQQSAELAAREAAQPAAIALAMCSQYRPNNLAGCERLRLPDPSAEIAYAGCLDYNRKDFKPCGALRIAYEGALHAYLDVNRPRPPATAPAAPALAGSRSAVVRRTAAELFKASNSDADTFQAALLIPEVRRKIERALGQPLTDTALHALIDRTRAEAVYWYTYMQRLERAGDY